MSTPRLSHTSYLVLGLIAGMGTLTPYELKQMVNTSLGYFWSFPHSQLYSEPDRLAGLGLLEVDQEDGGRRRKRYTITEAGHTALKSWLAEPETGWCEVRDPGLLQLFFGALAGDGDMARLAQARTEFYQQELARYEALAKDIDGAEGMYYPHATLQMGLAFVRASLAFWSELAAAELPPSGDPAE